MTSLHDALTDALDHPREYHPQRPKPLGKQIRRQTSDSTSFFWGVVASLAGAALILKFYKGRRA